MTRGLIYTAIGYLAGSILFAPLAAHLLGKEWSLPEKSDGNPGTANAFLYGGFLCGTLTLLGDLLKGFCPVFLYFSNGTPVRGFWAAAVLAAPVVGHAFPLFFRFRGGKGIAVSFGCLLGLLPLWRPIVLLAGCFIFFSVVLKISPHYHRTWVTYLVALALLVPGAGSAGFAVMAGTVCLRLWLSREEKERMRIGLLWRR